MNAEDLGSARIHTANATSIQFLIERQCEVMNPQLRSLFC